MKPSKNALTILLFLCLSISAAAQYNPLSRGQKSIFAESIEIEIEEYRRIRRKVYIADTLRLRLAQERAKLFEVARERDAKDSINAVLTERHFQTIASKDKTIIGLKNELDKAVKVSKKIRIFPDPLADTATKVGGGIILGIVIRSFFR